MSAMDFPLPARIHLNGKEKAGDGYRVDAQNASFPKRFLFQATLRGMGALFHLGRSREVPPGKAIFIEVPGKSAYQPKGAWEFVFFSVAGEWPEKLAPLLIRRFGPVLSLPKGSRALAVALEAAERAPKKNLISHYDSASLACRFLTALLSDLEGPPPGVRAQSVEAALSHIHRNFSSAINATQLADLAGQSREHFAREFKRQVGMAPAEYLERTRLGEAAALLTRGNLSVAEIAERVGYRQASVFTRAFKRRYGNAPERWRQSPM